MILDFKTTSDDKIGIDKYRNILFFVSKKELYKKSNQGKKAKAIISGFKMILAPIKGINRETIINIFIISSYL